MQSATAGASGLFFFQAEDGIRDVAVTGVQTCALPISFLAASGPAASAFPRRKSLRRRPPDLWKGWRIDPFVPDPMVETLRSAERTAGRWKVALALPLTLAGVFHGNEIGRAHV